MSGPTAADVARRAGVSPMTVSRVVNGDGGVQAETRQRVEHAVRTLGYVPNPAARSLAGARQHRIALVHSNPSAGFLSELLVGALAEASLHDAQLLVEPSADEPAASLIARLQQHRATAVLLPPPLCDDGRLVAALVAAGLRVARIASGSAADDAAIAVGIDDAAGARAITEHCLARGHRRIGFIAGDANQAASASRQAGWAAALRDAGCPAEPALIAAGDFTYRSGLHAASALLGRGDRPTAIFASNDDMAAAVIATAHRLGLDVPGDLSVCGFDDTAIATTVWPELTTVRQPIAAMARLAVLALARPETDRLDEMLRRRFDFELVVRGSVAPPVSD